MSRPEAVALISGGKDSLLSLYHAIANGYNIVALANLHPPVSTSTGTDDGTGTTIYDPQSDAILGPGAAESDELDSYMYQTIGHTLLPLYASCLGLPLFRCPIIGTHVDATLEYAEAGGDETEAMMGLLESVRRRFPNVTAVTSGAIMSTYQRTRIENVCARLGLTSLAYLWRMPQEEVLRQLTTLGFDARIVKVAALGLDEQWLWENVADPKVVRRLEGLRDRWGLNPAGEGGEYETVVIDAPGWSGRIVVDDEGRQAVSSGGGAAWLAFTKGRIEAKDGGAQEGWAKGLTTDNLFDPEFSELLEQLPSNTSTSSSISVGNEKEDDTSTLTPTISPHSISNIISPTTRLSLSEEVTEIFTVLANHTPLETITSITLLLRNMSDFAAINSVYSTFFPKPLPPSRVCVSVPGLPSGRNVMLSATFNTTEERKGLHVQSRSYWAPANIGPYSQAVRNNGWWEIAGQIPLVPASMELIKGENEACVLALQHLVRVCKAVGASVNGAVGWVADEEFVGRVCETWGAWDGADGPLMVVQATMLPRGAPVEWVGYCRDEAVGGGKVEVKFVDCAGLEDAVREIKFRVSKDAKATVFLPTDLGSVQEFLRAWGEGGVPVIPVRGIWDEKGMRRRAGVVVRSP